MIFDFTGTSYLDDSAAMVIEQLLDVAKRENTAYILMGLSGAVSHTLHALNILRQVPDGQIVETLEEARDVSYELLSMDETQAT